MSQEYLQTNGKLVMTSDGKLVQVPDGDNLNDLADTNTVMATQSEEVAREIEDLIVKNGVIDGSPRGVYENLSALQTAYPSGANGVYVCSDNGHWYYWNGSAWTDGGIYQTSVNYDLLNGKINNDVTYNELSSGRKEKKTLFSQGWISVTSGNVNTSVNMRGIITEDFITESCTLVLNDTTYFWRIFKYNLDGTYVSYSESFNAKYTEITDLTYKYRVACYPVSTSGNSDTTQANIDNMYLNTALLTRNNLGIITDIYLSSTDFPANARATGNAINGNYFIYEKLMKKLPVTLSNGYVSTSSGAASSSPIRGVYTNIINKPCIVKNFDTTNYAVRVFYYDTNDNFESYTQMSSGELYFNDTTKHYRFFIIPTSTQGLTDISSSECETIKMNLIFVDQTLAIKDYICSTGLIKFSQHNMFIVDKNGGGDFTSIQDAVDHVNNDDFIIYIREGVYNESVCPVNAQHIHFIGEDKHKTIIQPTNGDYNHPALWITNGVVENLTLYAKRDENTDYSGLTSFAYGLHLDTKFRSSPENKKCEIKNCIIKSDFNDAIGSGTTTDIIYDIHDCYIEATESGKSAFRCHLGLNQGNANIILKNNVLVAPANGYGVNFHDGGLTIQGNIDVLMIGNVCKRYLNQTPSVFIKNELCYGNSVEDMNK